MTAKQKNYVGTRDGLQKMVALCRLFNGNPFSLEELTDKIARKIGYRDRRSLCGTLRNFDGKNLHVLRMSDGRHSFSAGVLAEAFPERSAEPEKDAVSPAEQPDEEGVRTTAAFLNAGMTPLLHTALGLLADGSATRSVTVPDGNGGHTEERLSDTQLGLEDDEFDMVFPILEIVKILRQHDETGRDGKPIFIVNLPLVRGLMALLPSKKHPTAQKRETAEQLERQLNEVAARRGAIAGELNEKERQLPALRENVGASSGKVELLRHQLRLAQETLTSATDALERVEAATTGAELQDELLAHEEERLRKAHEELTTAAIADAVTSLKSAFTPAQLAMLKNLLG